MDTTAKLKTPAVIDGIVDVDTHRRIDATRLLGVLFFFSVGTLYYANTLGAGAACLLAAVLLFPFLGLHGSIYVAVGLNAAVGISALAAHLLAAEGAAKPSPAAVAPAVAAADRPRMAFPT